MLHSSDHVLGDIKIVTTLNILVSISLKEKFRMQKKQKFYNKAVESDHYSPTF